MPDLDAIKDKIKANVRMFSGCDDEQTSADVSNVKDFKLPDAKGKAGGACTSTMLSVLYEDETKPEDDLSFKEVLMKMRAILEEKEYTQIPQLSSSRPLDMDEKFDLVPDENFKGNKRALLIGINYVGHDEGELSGCHNDVHNMVNYIKDVHGFKNKNITILMDDGKHKKPTYANIIAAYRKLVKDTKPGDAVFCHYSGHGGRLKDDDGDEEDGYDESLVPVDYATAGQIRDDDLYKELVCAMPKDVTLTCIMDCCHSGTVLDLPYTFLADGEHEEMYESDKFDINKINGSNSVAAQAMKVDASTKTMEKVKKLIKKKEAENAEDDEDEDLEALKNTVEEYNKEIVELKELIKLQTKMQTLAAGIENCRFNSFQYRPSPTSKDDDYVSSEKLVRDILFSFQQNRGHYLPNDARAGYPSMPQTHEDFRRSIAVQVEELTGVEPKIELMDEGGNKKEPRHCIYYSC